jgi:lysophospholipase L1-like esterase
MPKFALSAALLLASAAFTQPAPSRVRIILVGDSTMAVGSGYGPGFCALATPQLDCVNMAKGGRSTLSYRAEGSWEKVMAALKDGAAFRDTYVLIQFGHNDQPGKEGRSTDLATEFPANMRRYAEEVKSAGAKPVLVTPLTRRTFQDFKVKDDLEPWAAATRVVAAQLHVPLLELHTDSLDAINKMGPAASDQLAMAPPPPVVLASEPTGTSAAAPKTEAPPVFDYTHLGPKGAAYFGRMAADELTQAIHALKPYFRE